MNSRMNVSTLSSRAAEYQLIIYTTAPSQADKIKYSGEGRPYVNTSKASGPKQGKQALTRFYSSQKVKTKRRKKQTFEPKLRLRPTTSKTHGTNTDPNYEQTLHTRCEVRHEG